MKSFIAPVACERCSYLCPRLKTSEQKTFYDLSGARNTVRVEAMLEICLLASYHLSAPEAQTRPAAAGCDSELIFPLDFSLMLAS